MCALTCLATTTQKRQEVFQRNLDDFSQPLSVNLCVKCQQLKLSVRCALYCTCTCHNMHHCRPHDAPVSTHYRFPMLSAPDAAPHPHLPWVQYWKEKLLFQVSALSLRSTLGQNSTTALSWCFQCERLTGALEIEVSALTSHAYSSAPLMTNHTGALISDGCPNGEQFLCVSGPEEDGEEEMGEEVENGPEVTITWTPPPTLPPDQHIPTVHSQLSTTRSLGDSILDAMEQMRGVPGSTPFSTGCTKHVTGVVSATDHLQPAPHACMRPMLVLHPLVQLSGLQHLQIAATCCTTRQSACHTWACNCMPLSLRLPYRAATAQGQKVRHCLVTKSYRAVPRS